MFVNTRTFRVLIMPLHRFLHIICIFLSVIAFIIGCTKQVQNNPPVTSQQENKSDVKGKDETADRLTKEADDADSVYQKTKNDADKQSCLQKQMAAANYLMFESSLSPKQKYRGALRRYKRVLEFDPGNQEAVANKKQIEDVYKSMGMPVPE